ncbi:MAG: ATPase domain-containing protein [Candidatus Bathyarchaeota archaeon]
METVETVETGIPGLNELIGGGLPEGRVILLVGGPGSGKTIFCSQFLWKGIDELEESAIFVSLDESKRHYFAEMKNFGWDFKKAEEEGKFVFIDATRMSRSAALSAKMAGDNERNSLRFKQLPIDRLVETIESEIHRIDAKRLVVDTLATLFQRFPDPIERRVALVDLFESLADLEISTILTSELGRLSLENREVSVEEYLAHGVILTQTLFSNGVTSRALQVEKMRGVSVNPNIVPYTIDRNGIEIFPEITLFGGT